MPSTLPLQYFMGIPDLDHQHQELQSKIELIEEVFSAGNFNEAAGVLKPVQLDLASHFIDEGNLMSRIDFPDKDSHTQDHSLILMLMDSIMKLSPEENSALILSSLRMSLKDHILRYDVPLSYFVHNQESFKKSRFKPRKFKVLTRDNL